MKTIAEFRAFLDKVRNAYLPRDIDSKKTPEEQSIRRMVVHMVDERLAIIKHLEENIKTAGEESVVLVIRHTFRRLAYDFKEAVISEDQSLTAHRSSVSLAHLKRWSESKYVFDKLHKDAVSHAVQMVSMTMIRQLNSATEQADKVSALQKSIAALSQPQFRPSRNQNQNSRPIQHGESFSHAV